ncbi:mitochondrial intermembrane space import and assembly protein 40 homolog [Ziziphus jujuba]|uniref:Mitochondrial intermembrane space import and assembly protein 40 homolog n=1 Tax=Ziziphus jujuba TaxID=326968 RepID=A0A6P4AEJ5_ZIZJJ|nr:mitochondrial intermembrane space import and assembly protein 40 homolog [Ziziphus jujuba]XP_048333582.1 mitochondrial intermembrane space import and assembly protein 40 homolog isoform X2 [Ziziphus jujuba var. spinosa]
MGQVPSHAAAAAEAVDEVPSASSTSSSASSSSSSSFSMESVIAEAAAYGNDGNESLDAKAQKALECPCIADLRSGPCGAQFSEAFLCFLKSTAEEKGSDCVNPFVALQNCIKANPDAFSKDVLEEDEVKNEQEENQQLRIIPPLWTKESQTPKSKL